MSKTNLQIIDQALTELGIVAAGETATAEQGETGLAYLNQMMLDWSVTDKNLNFPPQDTISDICPIPAWAESAVVANLAVELSSPMRAPITQPIITRAETSKNTLLLTLINLKNQSADMSHIPWGNYRDRDILSDA